MQSLFALFGLGGGEIVMILFVLILFGARALPMASLGRFLDASPERVRQMLKWAEFIFLALVVVLAYAIVYLSAR